MVEREPRIKLVARVILVDDYGRVLLGKRPGGSGAGQWALIGGKPDAGETFEEAIIRETLEEVGLKIEPEFICRRLNCLDSNDTWLAVVYLARIKGKIIPAPREVSEIKFVTADDFEELDIAFDHKEVLRELFSQ